MKYFVFYALTILMFIAGCKPRVDDAGVKTWQDLIIVCEHDVQITIGNNNDTSIINVFHAGSFFAPLPRGQKMKIDTIKAFFSKAEKDTIFSLVSDLIIHPAKTENFCTEYVGSLELIVRYGDQFKQSAKYSSVCNWNTLSDKTKQLHDILRKRIKGLYLGEKEPLP